MSYFRSCDGKLQRSQHEPKPMNRQLASNHHKIEIAEFVHTFADFTAINGEVGSSDSVPQHKLLDVVHLLVTTWQSKRDDHILSALMRQKGSLRHVS